MQTNATSTEQKQDAGEKDLELPSTTPTGNFSRDPDSQEEEDSGECSSDSNFEEEIDEGQSISFDLERNIQLMKRKEEQNQTQYKYEYDGMVIYDANAKMNK